MKAKPRHRLIGGLILSVGMVLPAAQALAQDTDKKSWDKEALQRLYVDYLSEEGYKPKIDSDGDVQFKREGKTYFISVADNDPEFFRVVLPAIWSIESEEERSQALVAADRSNALCKAAKVYTVADNVWVSLELFVAQPEDFKNVFRRAISALDNGAVAFAKAMRE